MRTWEDLKNDPSTFTNMSKEEETLIDTLAFLHATRIKMKISQVELGRKIGFLENLDVIPTFTTLGKYAAGLGFNLKLTVVPA